MASSSWQRLGEGFTTNGRRSSGDGVNSCDARQANQGQSKDVSANKWKPVDFMSSFSLQSKEVSPQKNDISWSDSSSEEDVKMERDKMPPITSHDRNRKRRGYKKMQTGGCKNKRPAVDFASCKSENVKSESCAVAGNEKGACLNAYIKCKTQQTALHSKPCSVGEGNKKFKDLNGNAAAWNDCEGTRPLNKHINSEQQTLTKTGYNKKSDDKCKKQDSIVKWNDSSFDCVDEIDASKPCDKNRNGHKIGRVTGAKNYEEIDIEESASESGGDNDIIENDVERSNVEDIASDDSEDVLQHQKLCESQSFCESPALPHERGSQQVDIGSMSSSVGTSPPSQRVGASDWAVRFQQEVSPDSKDKPSGAGNHPDSAKKKQRYSSKSLVGQLSRLIKREQSTARFWQHSSSKGNWNEDGSHKSVTLEIVSLVKKFSLYVAECRIIMDNDTLLHSNSKTCRLMLVRSHADKMGIQSDSTIELFPPWKQMDEGEIIVILCANQVRVVPPVPGTSHSRHKAPTPTSKDDRNAEVACQSGDLTKDEKLVKISFKWTCPCRHNLSIQSDQCPAYKSDHFIKFFSQMALGDQMCPPSHPPSMHLHSVQSSCPPSVPAVRRTLLESLQAERAGEDCMPPFTATVLRVFRQNNPSQHSVSLSVLLEDVSGSLALVQYEDMDGTSHDALWSRLYRTMEKECLCQGLSLVTRWNREKDPFLFQVIASTWRAGRLTTTDSQDNSQTPQIPQKIPSFCYTLQSMGDPKTCLQDVGSDRKPGLVLTVLEQVVMDKMCHQRFSCLAQVVDVQGCADADMSPAAGLFVCDPSQAQDRARGKTTFYPLNTSVTCVALDRFNNRKLHMCLLQDVVWDRDRIQADQYSTLLPQSSWPSLGVDTLVGRGLMGDDASDRLITVPILGRSSVSDSFVRVSGHIVHVNEDRCYSWEGCDQCGLELSTTQDTGCYHCPVCRRDVAQPHTGVSMEVDVLEDSCTSHIVKIDLSQGTITSLLPPDVPNEGFDVDLVLGKSISAMAFVVNRTSDTIRLYQVDL